jgi:1-pyrroline-5-carboxylate dehydrogenase
MTKCSAASRAYIPSNIAEEVKKKLIAGVKSFKMGTPKTAISLMR